MGAVGRKRERDTQDGSPDALGARDRDDELHLAFVSDKEAVEARPKAGSTLKREGERFGKLAPGRGGGGKTRMVPSPTQIVGTGAFPYSKKAHGALVREAKDCEMAARNKFDIFGPERRAFP